MSLHHYAVERHTNESSFGKIGRYEAVSLVFLNTTVSHACRVDLNDCNFELHQFNQDLDDDVIEILSLGVAYYWLSFKTLNSELLKNVLNSKDYYHYSPANLLNQVQTLRKTVGIEYRAAIRKYSYNFNTLETLKA